MFIVDELDRCNPHYAVKVLERIKHIFDIPNIVFVLSIDKIQLGNSIRGYYGSNLIDADEYLKRFIDIEYTLPDPDVVNFCSYLYEHYDFNAFFSSEDQSKYFNPQNEQFNFLNIAQILFKEKRLTIRQIEKIFTNTRLALNMFISNQYVYPNLFFLLTYFRICEYDLYEKIRHKEFSVNDLVRNIEIIIPNYLFNLDNPSVNKQNNRYFLFTITLLIRCYNRDSNGNNIEQLLTEKKQSNEYELTFPVVGINKETFVQFLNQPETMNFKIVDLSHFTNKISLLDNFNNVL